MFKNQYLAYILVTFSYVAFKRFLNNWANKFIVMDITVY